MNARKAIVAAAAARCLLEVAGYVVCYCVSREGAEMDRRTEGPQKFGGIMPMVVCWFVALPLSVLSGVLVAGFTAGYWGRFQGWERALLLASAGSGVGYIVLPLLAGLAG